MHFVRMKRKLNTVVTPSPKKTGAVQTWGRDIFLSPSSFFQGRADETVVRENRDQLPHKILTRCPCSSTMNGAALIPYCPIVSLTVIFAFWAICLSPGLPTPLFQSRHLVDGFLDCNLASEFNGRPKDGTVEEWQGRCLHSPPGHASLRSPSQRPRPIVGPSISPSRHICSRNAKVDRLLWRDLCSMDAKGAG